MTNNLESHLYFQQTKSTATFTNKRRYIGGTLILKEEEVKTKFNIHGILICILSYLF